MKPPERMSRVTRSARPLGTLLSNALPMDGSPVLAIDVDFREEQLAESRILHVRSTPRRKRSSAPFVHADLSALPARAGAFSACIVGSYPSSPWALSRSLRSMLRAGAIVVWIASIERAGWPRVPFSSRASMSVRVEDLCGALLAGGCRDIRVAEVEGRGNRVMAWGNLARAA